MNFRIPFVVLIAFAFPFMGCDSTNSQSNVSQQVVPIDDEDEEMNAAIAEARRTLPQFEANWKRPNVEGVSVKLAFDTVDGEHEHIWFTPIEMREDEITARCANEPQSVDGLAFGDVRTVDQSSLTDWMILENGKCYGGYTIRVLSKRDPGAAPSLEFADY
ncbi:DUF2314 domain-containing protein [Rhodopirellula sallentina]|uniref:DUF2314 domain-containing protein n=1 Tax=Rhodopirellula sallentina TaxID=1263869 RepID=UPI001360B114|nr:DUF2314 domain-containing protein [Rhodopirellula sallentina]